MYSDQSAQWEHSAQSHAPTYGGVGRFTCRRDLKLLQSSIGHVHTFCGQVDAT